MEPHDPTCPYCGRELTSYLAGRYTDRLMYDCQSCDAVWPDGDPEIAAPANYCGYPTRAAYDAALADAEGIDTVMRVRDQLADIRASATPPAWAPTVKRATLDGAVLDTYRTEGELNGWRLEQGVMFDRDAYRPAASAPANQGRMWE